MHINGYACTYTYAYNMHASIIIRATYKLYMKIYKLESKWQEIDKQNLDVKSTNTVKILCRSLKVLLAQSPGKCYLFAYW